MSKFKRVIVTNDIPRTMKLEEFTKICIDLEMQGQNPLFLGATVKKYKKRHKLLKSKDVIKTVTETLLDKNGIPYNKVTKGTSKQIPDTNAITKLIEDYMIVMYGCLDVRRVSSEGRWRKDASKNQVVSFLKDSTKEWLMLKELCLMV